MSEQSRLRGGWFGLLLVAVSLLAAGGICVLFLLPKGDSRQRDMKARMMIYSFTTAQVLHRERYGRFGSLDDLKSLNPDLGDEILRIGYSAMVWVKGDGSDWIGVIYPMKPSRLSKCYLQTTGARTFVSTSSFETCSRLPDLSGIFDGGFPENGLAKEWAPHDPKSP